MSPSNRRWHPLVGAIIYTCICILGAGTLLIIAHYAIHQPYTVTALHTLIAFMGMIGSAAVAFKSGVKPKVSSVIIYSALAFGSLIHLANTFPAFLPNLYPAVLHEYDISLLLIDTAVVAFLLLLSLSQRPWFQTTLSTGGALTLAAGLSAVPLTVCGLLYFLVLPLLPTLTVITLSIGAGILAGGGLVTSGILRTKGRGTPYLNLTATLTGHLLLAASCIPPGAALLLPALDWELALLLQLFAYLSFLFSAAIPILRETWTGYGTSIVYTLIPALFLLVPYILTLLIESFAPGIIYVNFALETVIHLKASLLAGVAGLLIYWYARGQSDWKYYLVTMMLVAWAVLHGSLAVLPMQVGEGDPMLYVVGCLVTFLMFLMTFRWVVRPPRPREQWMGLLFGLANIVGVVWVCASLYMSVGVSTLWIGFIPLSRSLLLVASLAVLTEISLFIFLIIGGEKGRLSVGLIAASLMAVLTITASLLAIFKEWTASWWVAHGLLVVALVSSPTILAMIYLHELGRAETLHRRAALYADILLHDISNYHQVIRTSLDLLDMPELSSASKARTMEAARSALNRAARLIENIRRLSAIEQVRPRDLVKIDLVKCIAEAMEQVILATSAQDVKFYINRGRGECFVAATELIVEVFLNLFRNAIDYSPEEKHITVEIRPLHRRGRDWWEIRVIDRGQGIEDERKPFLFRRYVEGARGTGLGLSVVHALVTAFGGSITVENRVPGDYTKGTVFILTLPAFTEAKTKGGEPTR